MANVFLISFLFLQQGYFRTSTGSFFIEPIEDYVDENRNILHLLYRSPRTDDEKGDTEKCDLTNSPGEFKFYFYDHHPKCLYSNKFNTSLETRFMLRQSDDGHTLDRDKWKEKRDVYREETWHENRSLAKAFNNKELDRDSPFAPRRTIYLIKHYELRETLLFFMSLNISIH